jgi:hydrogenase maturation protease
VLYEGYILYPYRASSVKNRQRWSFGSLYPESYAAYDKSISCAMQTECLVAGSAETAVEVRVRFLHRVARDVGRLNAATAELPQEPVFEPVPSLKLGENVYYAWEEAIEREVDAPVFPLAQIAQTPAGVPFCFPGDRTVESLRDPEGRMAGVFIRTCEGILGQITIAANEVAPAVFKLTVRIQNSTPMKPDNAEDRALPHRLAFASTHTVLGVRDGEFISLLEPPEGLSDAAAGCTNMGTWPVLAGNPGAKDLMLSSPIILYDYPQVASESPGDLFDATEIDEILTLRILSMTDEEKREMATVDERARLLLERTEALTADDMARLHGTQRESHPGAASSGSSFRGSNYAAKPELAFVHLRGRDLRVGDRVRLRPKGGADIMDIVLKDEFAIIEAIERDFEDKVHVAVVLEADPGREFGLERMPGHRFFFSPDEIEPAEVEARR